MEKYKKEKFNKDKNANMKKTNNNFNSTLRKSIKKEENKNNNIGTKIKDQKEKEKEIHIENQKRIKDATNIIITEIDRISETKLAASIDLNIIELIYRKLEVLFKNNNK